jgi:cytoskeletal protein RodZ
MRVYKFKGNIMGSQNKKPGRKVKTIPPSKKPRRKKGNNTTPIIIAVVGGMLAFLTIIIMVVGGKNSGNGGQSSTATVKAEEKKPKKTQTTKKNKKTSSATAQKAPAETTGPKVVNYNQAFAKKPGETDTAKTPTSDAATTEAPTATVTTKPKAAVEKPKPANAKEASIANLKAIGAAYKTYSDSHDGHMPIELFQLNLEASVLTSPLTNKEYIVEQAGKGSFLNESLESVIVRESSAVGGKYLCLYGNGEVKEVAEGEF